MRNAVTNIPLHLSIDANEDWLLALEFGAVADGTPPEEWVGLSENFAFRLRELGGPVIGFVVHDLSSFDPDDVGGAIWDGPRFDVPVLGLERASAGEIVIAAQATFAGISTADNLVFDYAVGKEDREEAEVAWRTCLGAGNLKAHYGLGYTLFELGRYTEAYAAPAPLHRALPQERLGLVLVRQGLRGTGRAGGGAARVRAGGRARGAGELRDRRPRSCWSNSQRARAGVRAGREVDLHGESLEESRCC